MLLTLNRLLKAITWQTSCEAIVKELYIQGGLLQKFAAKLSLSEYTLKPNMRKDIYTFIHSFILETKSEVESRTDPSFFKSLIPHLQPYWAALCKAAEIDSLCKDE